MSFKREVTVFLIVFSYSESEEYNPESAGVALCLTLQFSSITEKILSSSSLFVSICFAFSASLGAISVFSDKKRFMSLKVDKDFAQSKISSSLSIP